MKHNEVITSLVFLQQQSKEVLCSEVLTTTQAKPSTLGQSVSSVYRYFEIASKFSRLCLVFKPPALGEETLFLVCGKILQIFCLLLLRWLFPTNNV